MRILHAPVEVAGQVALQAHGQRLLGHDAVAWFDPHPFGYERGPDMTPAALTGWRRRLDITRLLWRASRRFDVVHFHSGRSLLTPRFRCADARLLKATKVRLIQQFVGSDARLPSVEARRNPWYRNTYGEDDQINEERVRRWAELTDGHVVFQDHSLDYVLAKHFSHLHVVPLCIDTVGMNPALPDPDVDCPVLAHAPSQRGFKGSEVVAAAVEELQRRGRRFRYLELHGRSHPEVIAAMATADLVVDQVRVGAFGTVSVEAIALGKPTVCYLLPEVRDTLPADLPLIDANPANLVEVLDEWLADGARRRDRGAVGRAYAERVHDIRVVAAQLVEVYRELDE